MYIKKLKNIFYLWILLFTAFLPSIPSHAGDTGAYPFTFSGADIQSICTKSPSVCEIWIDGVIEGIEFLKVASPSANQDMKRKNAVFCFADFSVDMKKIRMDLLESLSHENKATLVEQPAMANLIDVLEQYRCGEE